jgi:hypothetical protein
MRSVTYQKKLLWDRLSHHPERPCLISDYLIRQVASMPGLVKKTITIFMIGPCSPTVQLHLSIRMLRKFLRKMKMYQRCLILVLVPKSKKFFNSLPEVSKAQITPKELAQNLWNLRSVDLTRVMMGNSAVEAL